MAKESILQRNLNRQKLIRKYKQKRELLLYQTRNTKNFQEKYFFYFQLQKLPRNSAPNRLRNRCWKTGKPRGYFRFFGLCRHIFRELALQCYLPGLIKSSW